MKEVQLNPRQLKFLTLTHECKSQTQCATLLGVTRRTLYNWRKTSAFQQASEKMNQEMMQAVIERQIAAVSR